MDSLYLAIKARLKDQVPELRQINWFNNQFKNPKEPPLSFPCVFINFPNIIWQPQGYLAKKGIVTIELYLGIADYKYEDIGFFPIRNKIDIALFGWGGSDFNGLNSIGESPDTNDTNIYVYRMRYQCEYINNVARRDNTGTTATPTTLITNKDGFVPSV